MKTLAFVFLSALSLYSQTDWKRWNKAEIHYAKETKSSRRDYSLDGNNIADNIIKGAAILYWAGFSDLDGDNCPFTPTCSSFLLQSVKETNIVQGSLMFFDRFTRDTNIFDRHKHYPVTLNNRFYDPPALYTLNSDTTLKALKKMYSVER